MAMPVIPEGGGDKVGLGAGEGGKEDVAGDWGR